jgi:diphthine methyl ester synthase
MLTLVGLGLCDGNDITLRGKQAVDAAAYVYIESYTSLLQCSHEELEAQLGTSITRLSRTDVELHVQKVIDQAKATNVVVLVIGDVFGATTHTDLYLRAREAGVDVAVVPNASILNAIGAVGLELYRYGKTVSIPYWLPGFEPTSFVGGILENQERGLHTLCLLDIKADEHRFMTVSEGLELIMRAQGDTGLLDEESLVIGVARIGCPDQRIIAGPVRFVRQAVFGKPPHALVIPGKRHHIETEMLKLWQE